MFVKWFIWTKFQVIVAEESGRAGCRLGKENSWIDGLRFQSVDFPSLW